jgi:uncharacterized membrane protein
VTGGLHFELPQVLWLGGAPALVLLAAGARRLTGGGAGGRRATVLTALRAVAVAVLVLLAARPVAVARYDPDAPVRVALLLDSSRSMALAEAGRTRFEQLAALHRELVPALDAAGFEVASFLFAGDARRAAPAAVAAAAPDGDATDLAGAIAHALAADAEPPAALVAITDGAATESGHNRRALAALVRSATPLVAVGVGDDRGVPTLDLLRLDAPAAVPPRTSFRVTALLEAVTSGETPEIELLLLRRGRLVESRRVPPSHGSRLWTESFTVSEPEPGVVDYAVEVSAGGGVVVVHDRANRPVRVGEEEDFRVLFVQGALTWNLKFIGRALRTDPAVRLTGLSRTSESSWFRQSIESAEELAGGFPRDLAELAPFRVVILSELRSSELTGKQQEMLARHVGELGGGLLVIGGEPTFDASWRGSRLEELLPVTFDPGGAVSGLDRPFRLELSEPAVAHPAFRLVDGVDGAAAWRALPAFTHYGRVRAAKPGATVWARHSSDSGPEGRRIVIASQHYGAGISAVVTIRNLWRWRLAEASDPEHFDRFWRQFARFLGQAGAGGVEVHVDADALRPGADVRAVVERRPRPEADGVGEPAGLYRIRAVAPDGEVAGELTAELAPLRPAALSFRAAEAGVYRVEVTDGAGVLVATRPVEIRDSDREMLRTGRDLEALRQWAAASGGLALPLEELDGPDELVERLGGAVERLRAERWRPEPVGLSAPVLLVVLGALCAEWLLRKRWGLA